MGGGCVAVRSDRCLHGGALHRITVLCRSLLGLGESAFRSLAGRRRAHGVACTLRVSGLFLIGALLVMIITDSKPAAVKLRRSALMLIPASVIMAFATYLYVLTGSWTSWYRAQTTGWVRELTWPWESFLNTIPAILPGAYANHPWWAAVFRGEMISMAAGLASPLVHRHQPAREEVASWARQADVGEASWIGVQLLAFSMSYWFFSVNRATLLWFPLWIMLGRWVAGPGRLSPPAHRLLVTAAFTVEIVLMLWWSWLFFTGHWAS